MRYYKQLDTLTQEPNGIATAPSAAFRPVVDACTARRSRRRTLERDVSCGSFRQQSNVNLGVVEAHRKVPQGRGARWPTSHITRGLGRAPQTTPDSVALDTVATLTPKHTRMDDFCAWHSYGFVTLGTLHINGCMSHSHHITFNYSFGAFISRNMTAQLSKLTENESKGVCASIPVHYLM